MIRQHEVNFSRVYGNTLLVWSYIAAIVAANVTIAIFGPVATPIVAFLMIGATLTLRDKIHDRLGPRVMLYLVPAGTAISFAFSHDVMRIALAGAVAFGVSEAVDTIVYHVRRHSDWMERVLTSNVASAAVDSIVFPVLAFGGFPIWIILAQFIAKNVGGAMWACIIWRTKT